MKEAKEKASKLTSSKSLGGADLDDLKSKIMSTIVNTSFLSTYFHNLARWPAARKARR